MDISDKDVARLRTAVGLLKAECYGQKSWAKVLDLASQMGMILPELTKCQVCKTAEAIGMGMFKDHCMFCLNDLKHDTTCSICNRKG